MGELVLEPRSLDTQPGHSEISEAKPGYRNLNDDFLLLDLLLYCSVFHIFFLFIR